MTHEAIAEFLQYLHGSLDPEEEVYLAPADNPKAEVAVASLDEAIRYATELQDRGVFCSSGTFTARTARKREHLLCVPALLLDADLKDKLIAEGVDEQEADKKIRACSPAILEKLCQKHRQLILAALSQVGLEPSSLVFTGGGHQVYLSVDFLDQREVERLVAVHRALVAKLNSLAGWQLFDRQVVDSGTRYFRLPGTANTKSDPPRWAAIVQNSGPVYGLEQLETIVGQQSKEQATAGEEDETEEASAEVVRILLPYWKKGKRHDLALSLCGFLAKADWSWSKVKACLVAIASQAKDEELSGRLNDLKTTFARPAKGEEIRGYIGLAEILTAADLRRLEELTGSGEIPIDESPVERWPELKPEALHGLAGDFVKAVAPHTEADPVALLVNLITMFGNAIGANPYFSVEYTKHYLQLFAVLVGVTSKGRKGQSMSALRHSFSQVDGDWLKDRVSSGLSTGEGLIYQVRDMRSGKNKDGDIVVLDAGVEDKRFLAVEEEFAGVLKAIAREGNTMSAILRQAWDTGDLHPLTKTSPTRATGAHISLLGHITKGELLRHITETEQTNGFGNRILWFLIKRARVIPKPRGILQEHLAPLVHRLRLALDFARKTTELDRDEQAEKLWEEVYPELSEGKPGLFGALTARAEAQVMRLACLYALLDRSPLVQRQHLQAALALWDYSEESVRLIFGDALGDPTADEILRVLRRSPAGLTRTDIRDLFGRHRRATDIGRALGVLLGLGLVRREEQQTKGRPIERWYATATKETKATKGN